MLNSVGSIRRRHSLKKEKSSHLADLLFIRILKIAEETLIRWKLLHFRNWAT